MSRRHHGRPHHGRRRGPGPRPAPAVDQRPITATGAAATPPPPRPAEQRPIEERPADPIAPIEPTASAPIAPIQITPSAAPVTPASAPTNGSVPSETNGHAGRPVPVNGNGLPNGAPNGLGERPNGCTAPQLRRFIKSRPYVPMHELRRRFSINGDDDEVTKVVVEGSHIYVGLPDREGNLLGELLRGGEIGYELSLDPLTPVVVGVYPMRPVPRA
jgi:hypothetical protein